MEGAVTEPAAPQAITIDLIRRLIAFDTVSSNSNLALIDFVRTYLADFGIESSLVYDKSRQKANLYATIGPGDRRGVLLSGHTDVVPVSDQTWRTDPFQASIRDGRIYGRGSADMKSFIACVLGAVPELVRAPLRTPIHLSFSYDEEVGCVGVRDLIAILKDSPFKPRMCIVGEPTGMDVVIAHKGKYYLRARVRGSTGHSSLSPRYVNAIEIAAELIVHMRKLARRFSTSGPFDRDFDVPHLTIMTGIIHGGVNLNMVPKECWFDFEIRDLPRDDPDVVFDEIKRHAREVLEPEMHAIDPGTGIDFEDVSLRPSLQTEPDNEVVQLAQRLSCGCRIGKVAFGTEAALFQKHGGIASVVCGPGSIEQAHKPDEFIEFEQIVRCERFMQNLVDRARNTHA